MGTCVLKNGCLNECDQATSLIFLENLAFAACHYLITSSWQHFIHLVEMSSLINNIITTTTHFECMAVLSKKEFTGVNMAVGTYLYLAAT